MKKVFLAFSFLIVNLGILTTQAFANPVGILNLANCSGQGVTVTSTTVVFAGNCIQTGAGTSVTTSFGLLLPGVTGTIANLPVTPPSNPFMTFPVGVNTLSFFLAGVGPGVINTICPGSLNPNDPACSVFAGSPFILTPGAGGTTVRFDAHGVVSDASGPSNWNGSFSANFANQTPLDVRNAFVSSGSLSATTFAGSFALTATPIPEPLTLSMLSLGLLGIGVAIRRKARK
jgi:hypothetical protein